MDKVVGWGEFNGNVGYDMGGLGKVHGVFGIGQDNDGGVRLMDWAVGKGLCLMNMCFKKRNC